MSVFENVHYQYISHNLISLDVKKEEQIELLKYNGTNPNPNP